MKHFYALAIGMALFAVAGCSNDNNELTDIKQSKAVTFRTDGWEITTTTRATLAEAQVKELWVFDGAQQMAKQVSTDTNFGTVTLDLDFGLHNLSFIATSGEATVNGSTMSGNIGNCFGKLLPLDVDANTGTQNLVLPRITYAIYVSTKDYIPSNVTTMRLTIGNICRSVNVQTLGGAEPQSNLVLNVSVAAAQGKKYSNFVTGFCPTLDTEASTAVQIEFLAGSNVVSSHTVEVPIITNRKTIISGTFFGANAKGAVSVNTTWLDDEEIEV